MSANKTERVGVYVIRGEPFEQPRYFATHYPALAEEWDDCEVTILSWLASTRRANTNRACHGCHGTTPPGIELRTFRMEYGDYETLCPDCVDQSADVIDHEVPQ